MGHPHLRDTPHELLLRWILMSRQRRRQWSHPARVRKMKSGPRAAGEVDVAWLVGVAWLVCVT